jgi:triosephosphate isomerase
MAVPLIIGNWKMNGVAADLAQAEALAAMLRATPHRARVALCPPATLIERMARLLAGTDVLVGAGDAHAEPSGAFTGDVSAEMLADAGARLVIVGHSERRATHRETDAMVGAKAFAVLRAGLEPIICVGETFAQREAGRALDVVKGQIATSVPAQLKDADALSARVAIAYEPVWAIGTGLVPTIAQIEEAHGAIRKALIQRLGEGGRQVNILYGGSVTPDNAREILHAHDVGGALVGRASLKADAFMRIIEAA